MKRFKEFIIESMQQNIDTAIDLCKQIEKLIPGINLTKIQYNKKYSSGRRIHIDQFLQQNIRDRYSDQAKAIISRDRNFSAGPGLKPGRTQKDFSFTHNSLDKGIGVYVQNRPDGKSGRAGDDPNELMTAALCLLPRLTVPKTVAEMDALIEEVKKLVTGNNIVGATAGQINSLDQDYDNLCKSVSAAIEIHKNGWGGSDKVFLTGQSWDQAVKKFQISKYGMKDFNSSDFIVQKQNKFLGVSLKKKTRITEPDPTLINKSFVSILQGEEFDSVRDELEEKTSEFYLQLMNDEKLQSQFPEEVLNKILVGNPDKKTWRKFINDIPNDIINQALKGRESLFKDISEIILNNKNVFANQLIELIFKTSLTDLKKLDFDFALVTGKGGYGIVKGVDILPADYVDIDTMTTKLNELAQKGGVALKPREDIKQAYDPGATAAILTYVLEIGNTPLCYIKLRYKGNFSSSPSFLAEMTKEFKDVIKTEKS